MSLEIVSILHPFSDGNVSILSFSKASPESVENLKTNPERSRNSENTQDKARGKATDSLAQPREAFPANPSQWELDPFAYDPHYDPYNPHYDYDYAQYGYGYEGYVNAVGEYVPVAHQGHIVHPDPYMGESGWPDPLTYNNQYVPIEETQLPETSRSQLTIQTAVTEPQPGQNPQSSTAAQKHHATIVDPAKTVDKSQSVSVTGVTGKEESSRSGRLRKRRRSSKKQKDEKEESASKTNRSQSDWWDSQMSMRMCYEFVEILGKSVTRHRFIAE